MAAEEKDQAKRASRRHHYHLTSGRELTHEEIKKLQSLTEGLEVRKAALDGDHEHHSDHGGGDGPDA